MVSTEPAAAQTIEPGVIVSASLPEIRECVLRTIAAMLTVDNLGVRADSIVDTRDSRGVGVP